MFYDTPTQYFCVSTEWGEPGEARAGRYNKTILLEGVHDGTGRRALTASTGESSFIFNFSFMADPGSKHISTNFCISGLLERFGLYSYTTVRGKAIDLNFVAAILHNRKFLGEYKYREIIIPNGIPSIVPQDLFDRVQDKLAKNKKAPPGIRRILRQLGGVVFRHALQQGFQDDALRPL